MKYILVITLFFMFSCSRQAEYAAEIEQVLQAAGDNRVELEKVLRHYATDTLKLRAAEFLIVNLPEHYSWAGEGLEPYYDASDSIAALYDGTNDDTVTALMHRQENDFSLNPRDVSDLQIITSEYLIANIDRAFDDWQNGAWAKHLNFDEFCEYLLPYKVVDGQTLDNWREYLSTDEFGVLRYQKYGTAEHSTYYSAEFVNRALEKTLPKLSVKTTLPVVRRLSSLVKTLKLRDCDDFTVMAVAAMRAKGLPTVMDFTPQWADARLGHSWCVLLSNSGHNVPFSGMSFNVGIVLRTPMSKAYRHTFAINPDLLVLHQSGEPAPPLFIDPCIKDVTGEYQRTSDIELPLLRKNIKNRYAFLCTFDDRDWNPVAFGKISGGKARFEKLGRDVVYIVAVLGKNSGLQAVSRPFILDLQGKMTPIVPDTSRRQTLRLYRKHPASHLFSREGLKIIGSRFEAANRPDFSDAVTVFTINKYGTESDEILLNPPQKFRFWRHYPAPDSWGAMAEIYFFSEGENITIRGQVIGIAGKEPDQQPARLFDNDPVTSFNTPSPSDGWGGLDFGEPVAIDRILYAPRIDGNGIAWGDEYELCYWNDNRWQSLGRKTADNIYIEFDNCPVDALFLLHDRTRGIEERIFLYKDGKQEWW